MKVSRSLEEIRRIKEKMSADISGLSHEGIIRYFRERRPPEVSPLGRFEGAETPPRISKVEGSHRSG